MNFLKNIFILILLTFLIASCNNSNQKPPKRIKKDRLLQDSLYKKQWLKVKYWDGRIEEVEIYVSKENDTVTNQYKPYLNNRIDSTRGEFYHLETYDTEKNNIYRGTITMHSKYYDLELNENNSRTIEFTYFEQNQDSVKVTTKKSETSNTIEFEYENYYSNQLQGVFTMLVFRDTIVGKKSEEDMLNMYQLELLVDNKNITDNPCLDIYEFKKSNPFNESKLKYNIK